MKKSRIEDLLIEEARNYDDIDSDGKKYTDKKDIKDDINTVDSDGVKIIDLADKDIEDKKESKTDKIKGVISAWYKEKEKKRKKRRRGKSKLRRICTILACSLVITFVAICIWDAAQMKKYSDIRSSINETYNSQQLNMEDVERLGNLFTIHDKASFDWCMNNINMTNDVKSKLFTVDSNGKFNYTGQELSGNPTFQCTEIMFANSDDPLQYLSQYRVVLANGNVRYFFVVSIWRNQFDKMVLTGIYIY